MTVAPTNFMKIDFSQVKLIPVASVLHHYGVDLRKSGEYLVAKKCPLPTHTSKDLDTFKISILGNWWTCFSDSCRAALRKKGGDGIDFVCLKENLKPLDAAKKLSEMFYLNQNAPAKPERNGDGLSLANHGQRVADYADLSNRQLGQPAVAYSNIRNKPLTWQLQGINPEHPMIQARGISVETARNWGVGFYCSKQGTASMDNRIVFPLHEDGKLIGYAGRVVEPGGSSGGESGGEPKWKLGKGICKSVLLYGIERCDPAKPVILCESPWEVLLGFQMGKQTVSLIGCTMSPEQERLLEPFETIWVMMDDDKAGRDASVEICLRLSKHHKIIRSFLKD